MSERAMPTRRGVVLATALSATATAALAGCGDGEGDGGTTSPSATSSAGAGSGGGSAITQLDDVPVGGAISASAPDGKALIVAQPTAGKVVAFDSRCPHQGCAVAPVDKGLTCPCHGSTFELATGDAITGPATSGLVPFAVTVADGAVVAG